RPGGSGGRHRRRDAQPPPRRGHRHPPVRARRRDHRRPRQRQGRRRREPPHRADRRLRQGVGTRARVLHDLRAHGARARAAPGRTLREDRMTAIAAIGRTRALALLAGLVVLAALPYVTSAYTTSLVSLMLIAAMLAASVNFMAGQMGLVSVGHAGIAATAGYGVAWAADNGWSLGSQLLLALVL